MRELILRQARSGDGAGLARIWIDGAAHYASLAPEAFQVPRAEGLAEWLEQEALSTQTYSHVAVLDDELVGHVWAAVLPPSAQAAWQMLRDLTHTRLTIHWLGVLGAHRRQGIGTRLMVEFDTVDWPRVMLGNGPPVVGARPTLPTKTGRLEVGCAGGKRRWNSSRSYAANTSSA